MSRKMVFSGGLKFFSLADIFQMLGGNSSTGRLKLKGPQHLPVGYIYFINGNPVNAVQGNFHGIEAINAMFGWMEGDFEFFEEEVTVEHTIRTGRMKIVLDALRMLDEGIIETIGPPGSSPISGFMNQQMGDTAAVIKGPPINYVYLIDEEKFIPGDQIVLEGNQCHGLRVILEGTVQITRQTPNASVVLTHLGEGSFIGTFTCFTYPKSIRTATAEATSDVYLGRLDYLPLYFEYSSLSLDFRKLLLSLAGRLKKINDRMLMGNPHMQNSSLSFDDEEMFTKRDLLREDIFTITEGEVFLFDKTSASDQPLIKLEKDDVFGSLPFLSLGRDPDLAKIIASKDLTINKLTPEKILAEYERLPVVFQNMVQNLCMCVEQTTRNCLSASNDTPAARTLH